MAFHILYMQAFSYLEVIWKNSRKYVFIIHLLLFLRSQLRGWLGESYQLFIEFSEENLIQLQAC